MLLWLREELRIALAPERIACVRIARRWRPRVIEKTLITLGATEGTPAWRTPLAQLGARIKSASVPVSVVLSNAFARYVVLPWHEALVKAEERHAAARHCFKEVYGDMAGDWAVELSDGGYGAPSLACAVDAELLAELRKLVSEAGCALVSVQPYLMVAFNRFRGLLRNGKSASCFVLAEPGNLCLALVETERWLGVVNARAGEDGRKRLRAMLVEAASGAGLAALPERMFVHAPEMRESNMNGAGLNATPLRLHARAGFSPEADAGFSMAMCGIA